ncbi:MAG: hypothetical protein OJI70_16700 [Zavarzinia sp.]|nr:hypothetical protein [Zavarzinia sp.]
MSHPTWGKGNTAPKTVRAEEISLEQKVTDLIGAMPFLWLSVPDASGPESLRGVIERNSIALLSNFEREPLDPPSADWLGRYSDRDRIRRSGLWNSNHVDEVHNSEFLKELEKIIIAMDNNK